MDELTCRDIVGALNDYVDGRLTVEHQRAFDEHFADCPCCVEFLQSYRDTSGIFRRSTDIDLPEGMDRRLRVALRSLMP